MSIQTSTLPALLSLVELRECLRDKSQELKELVTFAPNKYHSVHRWFPFVEGFSSEFVRRIISTQSHPISRCYDPFGGVGTTALTCQELGIECISSEANPFIAEVAFAKMASYNSDLFNIDIDKFEEFLLSKKGEVNYPLLESKTFFEVNNDSKWIFHEEVSKALIDIKDGIDSIEFLDSGSVSLFRIAVASIIVSVSNVFRNGKCLSYRDKWQERKFERAEVHAAFIDYCRNTIYIDLVSSSLMPEKRVNNASLLKHGDSRKLINDIEDSSIDLVITSPPYLNSRDYTDIYRLELWMLGYVDTFEAEKLIRKSALTSHVQVALPDFVCPDSKVLKDYLSSIEDKKMWNRNLSNMIKGYFSDMESFLKILYNKLADNASTYINVSNSAYFSLECEVDLIIAEIASRLGYKVLEIQIARNIKSSSQQKLEKPMRESVIVLKKLVV